MSAAGSERNILKLHTLAAATAANRQTRSMEDAVRLVPGPGETVAGPYRPMRFDRWSDDLLELAGTYAVRPRIIAIDGRGGAGKSVLTQRIADAVEATAVVHTDDLAWHYSMFGWGELLVERFLLPLRHGEAVDVRPPGWATRGRRGRSRRRR